MIIVTGATGHIGNVLVRELLKKGEKVRVLLKHGSSELPLEGLDVEKCYGDIRNIDDLRKAFDGVDTVYHLAALISVYPLINPNLKAVNTEGTKNVGQVCLELGIKKLVYTSSVHAIQDIPIGTPITEETPISAQKALGKYGKTKAAATLALLDMHKNRGLPVVIVQPAGVIGPNDFLKSALGISYSLMMKNILIFSMPGMYNFVDVRDVVSGIIAAGEKGRIGERYILSGNIVSIKDKKKTIDKILGRKHIAIPIPKLLGFTGAIIMSPLYKVFNLPPMVTYESLKIVLSNPDIRHDKASRELGYTVRPYEDTMVDTISWLKRNQHVWKKVNSEH